VIPLGPVFVQPRPGRRRRFRLVSASRDGSRIFRRWHSMTGGLDT
jgi:hypothetical protein